MNSGSKVKKLFWPLLQKQALHTAHCLHATSILEYEDIRRMGFRQPVCLVPNGIDLPEKTATLEEKRKEILYLGRLHPTKGLDNLLNAWSKLEREFSTWCLIIAGPDASYGKGDQYALYLKDLVRKLNLKHVRFPGALYGEAKYQAYRAASLFVLPTRSENFGMSVAEALASGTPTIVTKGAPWKDLESHGAGWWIPIGVEPLTDCLRAAMRLNALQLFEMGGVGRVWMGKDFSWNDIGLRMLEAYQWLTMETARPGHVILD